MRTDAEHHPAMARPGESPLTFEPAAAIPPGWGSHVLVVLEGDVTCLPPKQALTHHTFATCIHTLKTPCSNAGSQDSQVPSVALHQLCDCICGFSFYLVLLSASVNVARSQVGSWVQQHQHLLGGC